MFIISVPSPLSVAEVLKSSNVKLIMARNHSDTKMSLFHGIWGIKYVSQVSQLQ